MPNHDDPSAHFDRVPMYVFASFVALAACIGMMI
jgi:hypothetical protein